MGRNARFGRSSAARPEGLFCRTGARPEDGCRQPNWARLHPRSHVWPNTGNQTAPKRREEGREGKEEHGIEPGRLRSENMTACNQFGRTVVLVSGRPNPLESKALFSF